MDKTRFMFARAALVLVASAGVASAQAPQAAPVAPAPATDTPRDFIDDAKVFYRVVACGNPTEPVPAGLDQKTVDTHCAEMAKRYEYIKKRYLDPASTFF